MQTILLVTIVKGWSIYLATYVASYTRRDQTDHTRANANYIL